MSTLSLRSNCLLAHVQYQWFRVFRSVQCGVYLAKLSVNFTRILKVIFFSYTIRHFLYLRCTINAVSMRKRNIDWEKITEIFVAML
jgi:hypothetical protein